MSNTRPDVLQIIKEARDNKHTRIKLVSKNLFELPEEIFELEWLEDIDLRYNKINTLPDSIKILKNLKNINLVGNPLNHLADIFGLTLDFNIYLKNKESIRKENVTGIKLIAQDFKDNSIGLLLDLINLVNLDISGNQLQAVPIEVSKLHHLTHLDLSDNLLTILPENITNLTNLTNLNLGSNRLGNLPKNIGNLSRLNYLVLGNNKLNSLPESVSNLISLNSLFLSINEFKEFPVILGELVNLSFLFVDGNRLTKLPESIGNLNKLKYLFLDMNKLTRLPNTMKELTDLSLLSLSYNKLKKFPEVLCELLNLNYLLLENNKITELPKSLGGLSSLSSLNLIENPIKKIPESIVSLSDDIDIKFPNSLTSPPYEIAEQGIPAIRKYFEDLESQGEEFIYEAKLVIVGEPWAGKSTLAAKLLNPDAELTPYTDETMTRGIDILQWKFSFADNIDFTANVWDFAGQEILQSTHRYFLTKRTLYAIVIDTRPERDVLYDWLQNLKHFADHPPVVLILNERDDHRIEIPDSILNAFPFIKKPIYCVNFKTKRGLDDLIKGIQTELKTLPHIGKEPIPKNRVKLKTELEKITTDTIPVEDYFSLCAKVGNYSQEDARRISHFLHDLGYILHFQKDISLDNTVILNKQWATKAVYLVLDEKNKEKSEKFTVSDIRRIWKDYDKNRYSDLIQLMKNFLICYELNNQEYILPQLLSVNPPENYKWEYTDNLFFEFSYPEFMPKGLLPRFIVKIHQYIHKGIQWKAGVQLCYQNSFAEVIEDYPKSRIRIKIAGKEKVEFLAIIRKEMDELHSFYLNLLVEPMIPCKCDGCKSSNEPHLFPYSVLKEYKKEKIYKIRCGKYVKQEVEVLDLLEGYELETKEDQFNYPLDKDRNVPGAYFEKIIEGLLKRVYHNGSIEPNFKLKDQNGKEFEYDFIVTNSELREIIVVEAKGYHDKKKIPLGSDSEKETVEWFFQKTFRNIKDNYPNPQNYQIKACYITSAFFTDEATAKLEDYNKTKFKSKALDVYYDRDRLFQLLKEKGMEKDVKNIKTFFRKQS